LALRSPSTPLYRGTIRTPGERLTVTAASPAGPLVDSPKARPVGVPLTPRVRALRNSAL